MTATLEIRTLLIIEDEPAVLEGLKEATAEWGLITREAQTAEQALKILKSENITAVLSDINLIGGPNGFWVLEQALGSGIEIPFLFLTGDNTPARMREAIQLGAIDFLTKPYKTKQLEESLFRLLDIGVRMRRARHANDPAEKTRQEKLIRLLKIMNSKP